MATRAETTRPSCSNAAMQSFFTAYADALSRRDMDGVLKFLTLPIIVRMPTGATFITQRDELIGYNQLLFEQYDRLGMVRLEYRYARGRVTGETSAAGAAEWTMVCADGTRMPPSEVAYSLESVDGEWKITAIDIADRVRLGDTLGW